MLINRRSQQLMLRVIAFRCQQSFSLQSKQQLHIIYYVKFQDVVHAHMQAVTFLQSK
jgi:hypothetical protein